MLSDNPISVFCCLLVDFLLFTRKILVAEPNHRYFQGNLDRKPAQYNYMETIARTFINPSDQKQFIQEKNFNNDPIRSKAVAMNKQPAFVRSFHENPFSYH